MLITSPSTKRTSQPSRPGTDHSVPCSRATLGDAGSDGPTVAAVSGREDGAAATQVSISGRARSNVRRSWYGGTRVESPLRVRREESDHHAQSEPPNIGVSGHCGSAPNVRLTTANTGGSHNNRDQNASEGLCHVKRQR
jgi:hypothetical protein